MVLNMVEVAAKNAMKLTYIFIRKRVRRKAYIYIEAKRLECDRNCSG